MIQNGTKTFLHEWINKCNGQMLAKLILIVLSFISKKHPIIKIQSPRFWLPKIQYISLAITTVSSADLRLGIAPNSGEMLLLNRLTDENVSKLQPKYLIFRHFVCIHFMFSANHLLGPPLWVLKRSHLNRIQPHVTYLW